MFTKKKIYLNHLNCKSKNESSVLQKPNINTLHNPVALKLDKKQKFQKYMQNKIINQGSHSIGNTPK